VSLGLDTALVILDTQAAIVLKVKVLGSRVE